MFIRVHVQSFLLVTGTLSVKMIRIRGIWNADTSFRPPPMKIRTEAHPQHGSPTTHQCIRTRTHPPHLSRQCARTPSTHQLYAPYHTPAPDRHTSPPAAPPFAFFQSPPTPLPSIFCFKCARERYVTTPQQASASTFSAQPYGLRSI